MASGSRRFQRRARRGPWGTLGPCAAPCGLLLESALDAAASVICAPDANSLIESWIGSFEREARDHFLCNGLHHLGHLAQEYAPLHNTHRPHPGLENHLIPAALTQHRLSTTRVYT